MDTILISDDDEDLLNSSVQIIGQFKVDPKPLEPSSAPSPILLPDSTPSPPLIPPPTPSPPPREASSIDSVYSSSSASPSKGKKRPSPAEKASRKSRKNDTKKKSDPAERLALEEAKRLKQKELEKEKLLNKAKRENAVCRSDENCLTKIDRKVLDILDDRDEVKLHVLFDEGSMRYIVESNDENTIKWTYKRVEVEEDALVTKYDESDWTMIVLSGREYLERILTYRDNPDDPKSLKSFICNLSRRHLRDSGSNIVILVYNLAEVLRIERAKEIKSYRQNFRKRFEEGDPSAPTHEQLPSISETPVLYIGPKDLQELRLTVEIDIKYNNPNWKVHLEFHEKSEEAIKAILCYSKSIARSNRKIINLSELGIDWAIDADKDRASDPTRSTEELKELWMKQLQQFASISLPIAKAIVSEYPFPRALIDQYNDLTTEEAETLLAELYVQKNLRRQIGQSISRKIHCFMTSRDPNILIDT